MALQGSDPVFALSGVSKTFKLPFDLPFKPRETVRALDSVDLSIHRGEVTCLLGPNGAGKTTLIKILGSLITADSGTVLWNGESLETAQHRIKGRIGLVTPNERAFYWRLSGRENLIFYASLHGFRGGERARRVNAVLEETGMTESSRMPYRLYSAGMKQKLNIARALLGNPELYLLDEPAAHLDPLAKEDFRRFISTVLVAGRGASVFLCTHDLEEARCLADRIVVLHRGRVVAAGRRNELLAASGGGASLTITATRAAHAGATLDGLAPATWTSGRPDGTVSVQEAKLRVAYDPRVETPEDIIEGFVRAGGRLREVHDSSDDLLDLIKRITGGHA